MKNMSEDSFALIRRGLSLLHHEGDVVELRVPKKQDDKYSKVMSGFFNNLDKLARAIDYINTKHEVTVFMTLNPIKATWQAVNNRAYVGGQVLRTELENAGLPLEPRMKKSTNWETGETRFSMRTTDGADILERRWILIDVDAGQPAGMNSSNAEHEESRILAEQIRDFLKERGLPTPAITDSGNGFHCYLRISLDNTPQNELLVKRFLLALAQRFDGTQGAAHIDCGMFDANRITKAAGTIVFKGPDTPDRPQRRSQVFEEASARFAIREQIEKIALEYTPKEGETFEAPVSGDAIGTDEMSVQLTRLKAFLDFYDIDYTTARMSDGYLVIPVECPNSADHSMDGGDLETIASIDGQGRFGFVCQHDHCQAFRGWKNFRRHMEEKTGKRMSVSGASVGTILFGDESCT
jgi:hypothetical protein